METVVIIYAYAVVSLVFVTRTQANKYSDPYRCYGDVCNSDTPAQFCDIVYRHCRRCDEIKGDCFTRHQTFNCTEYCFGIRYEKDVEQLRVAGCQIPPPPEHGRFEETHKHIPINATLNFTCDKGYELKNKESIRCGDYSIWIGPQPKCEGSTNNFLIFIIVFGVCLLVSVLGNIFFLTSNRWRSLLRNRKKETSRLLTPDKNEINDYKMPNGTSPSAEEFHLAPSAPPVQELASVTNTQEIDLKSNNKQTNQPREKITDDCKKHDISGRSPPRGRSRTSSGGAHLPTAEEQSQPENNHTKASTGHGNAKGTTIGASTRPSADNQRPHANADTTVGQIINYINNITTEVRLVYPPQSTAAVHSTPTSQIQKPDGPFNECDKRPVDETGLLGSSLYAPSKSVSATQPEDKETHV